MIYNIYIGIILHITLLLSEFIPLDFVIFNKLNYIIFSMDGELINNKYVN
jgi:hypothetical protein